MESYEIREARERLHILEPLVWAVEHRREFMELMDDAESAEAARRRIEVACGFDEIQATAVLDLQVRRFAGLERARIVDERDALLAHIRELGG